MDVIDSQGLWSKWSIFKANQPKLVLLTCRSNSYADGFDIHPSPPEMVSSSSLDSSDSEPDPELESDLGSDLDSDSSDPSSASDSDSEYDRSSGPPSTGPPDIASDSFEPSEEEDDLGRMGVETGTVRTEKALVNVQRFGGLSLTAMPNVREKDESISARNHEPDSFAQSPRNHDRRPLTETSTLAETTYLEVSVAHPKLLLEAMELLTNSGATVEVPLESMITEMGEGGVIGHLLNKMATIRLAPASRNTPARMTIKPQITLGTLSLANVITEKQKALAKLTTLAPQAASLTPRATGNVMIAAYQLSHAEWMR
jgi:hypothetical protein